MSQMWCERAASPHLEQVLKLGAVRASWVLRLSLRVFEVFLFGTAIGLSLVYYRQSHPPETEKWFWMQDATAVQVTILAFVAWTFRGPNLSR